MRKMWITQGCFGSIFPKSGTSQLPMFRQRAQVQQKPKPEDKEAPAPSRDRGDTGGQRPVRGTEREQEEVLEDPRPKIPTALRGARGRCRDGRALAAQGFLRSRSLSGGAHPVLTLLLHLSIRLSILIKSDT